MHMSRVIVENLEFLVFFTDSIANNSKAVILAADIFAAALPILSRTSVGRSLATVFFFFFGAVPNVCTVMRSGHVQQSDVNMIDKWTSADQLAS